MSTGGYWFTTVIGDDDGSTSALVIVPSDVANRDAVLRPMRRNGWSRVSRAEWLGGIWGYAADGVLDVVKNDIVRIGAGSAQVFASQPVYAAPVWRSSARERRGLVVVVGPDSFPDRDITPDRFDDQMVALAGAGQVTAALVTVRFDEFDGPWPKGWGKR